MYLKKEFKNSCVTCHSFLILILWMKKETKPSL